jgi:hypothetical protein
MGGRHNPAFIALTAAMLRSTVPFMPRAPLGSPAQPKTTSGKNRASIKAARKQRKKHG